MRRGASVLQILLLALGAAGSPVPATAGVITGGGGGVLNPSPVAAEEIERAVLEHGYLILTSWFQRVRYEFLFRSDDQKARSPFVKLFGGDRDIFSVIESTGVEIRAHQPCFDGEDQARDGSVFATSRGYVCLSSFTMAGKLSFYNVEVETLALLAHELSHLLGTTEDEAVAIQLQFVHDFARTNFSEREDELKTIAELREFRSFFEQVGARDAASLAPDCLGGVSEAFSRTQAKLAARDDRLWYLPPELMTQRRFQEALLWVVRESGSDRSEPGAKLDAIFGERSALTATELLAQIHPSAFCAANPGYCFPWIGPSPEIVRPRSASQSFALLDRFVLFVKRESDFLRSLMSKTIRISRN